MTTGKSLLLYHNVFSYGILHWRYAVRLLCFEAIYNVHLLILLPSWFTVVSYLGNLLTRLN